MVLRPDKCHGLLNINCGREPEINSPIILNCFIKNSDDSLHTGSSKRFLSGQLRVQVAKELCEGRMEPHVWRTSQANKLMDFGDSEPSHLPNLATLCKAKQEKNDLALGDKSPIVSLQMLKYSAPHSDSLKDIGLDKFFCHYWSQTQMHVYKTLKKSHPILCVDATGSIVKKLMRPNGMSGHIFLYQGVMTGHTSSSVPVVQMLSEKHDVNAITQWLKEWIHAGAPAPKEAVSDFPLAILGALVEAFTPHPDLKSYINECFNILRGNQPGHLPPCFVRVDIAHCIKMICRWDCLKNKRPCVKDFFVRSIAQLLKSQCLQHAKELLRAITIVALSETEGNDSSGAPIPSEKCKKYSRAQIAEEFVPISDEEVEGQEPGNALNQYIQTNVRQWVTEVCEESRSLPWLVRIETTSTSFIIIIPHITRLGSYLPLWTAIIVPLFKITRITASSAAVEAEFKNIKKRPFHA
nr:tRNA (guanine-N(7)-)-methyltransferase non-catalytic subunit wdr4 isoform X1 [Syngnathus scovelli]